MTIQSYSMAILCLLLGSLSAALTGCATTEGNIALGVGAATIAGGHSPSNEIQQIYYLGVFDPQDQLPPTVYRVRVHGQASFISRVKFASGWVPAQMVDSLGGHIAFEKNGEDIKFTRTDDSESFIPGKRKLLLFGPEGFREAPKDHRLVIVMGSSPEKFFSAIDQSLGSLSGALHDKRASELNQELLKAALKLTGEQRRLDDLARSAEQAKEVQK